MEKTTRKLNDLLSQFLSLRNEVSEIADKTADAVFDSVESGDITKEEALTILTDNKLLPVANWICLPDFMDDYGDNMAALGLTNYISESTRYGDWSCSTWSTPRKDVEAQLEELNALGRARWELMKQYGEDSVQAKIYDDKIADASLNIEKIGYFCADAGMVAVFLLDEVLKYNPDFDYHINREWTTTLIKDFDGEINYYVDDDAHIIGVGNVNFFTTQTGF